MKLLLQSNSCTQWCALAARRFSTTANVAARNAATASCNTMPPGFTARTGQTETFFLPAKVSGSVSDRSLASAMVKTWRKDGIIQIAMSRAQQAIYEDANAASRSFFGKHRSEKSACIDGHSYAGYIASGEEITDGIADYSEIFTVTKDIALEDPRCRNSWPCHGPCPWPDARMKTAMERYMGNLSENGEKLLHLIELGLDVPEGALTSYTQDGWHHMRVLR